MSIEVVKFQAHEIDCAICGEPDVFRWGVPTYNGDIVSNDFPDFMWGKNGGSVAVCERCHRLHAEGKIPAADADYLRHGTLIDGDGI